MFSGKCSGTFIIGGIGPEETRAYKTLATNAVPTTTFNTGMLRAVISIANFPIFIPVILIDMSLNSLNVISSRINLLCSSLTENAIDINDRVGIRCHIEALSTSEISLSTKDSTFNVNS